MSLADKITKFAPVFSAVGTMTIAGVAVWGFFFTSIPQAVVRQLQSEAADANERVVSLQQQTRQLITQTEEANRELTSVQREKEQVQRDLQLLQNQATALAKTTKAIQQQKASYLKNTVGIVIKGYLQEVNTVISNAFVELEEAEQFDLARKWVASAPKYLGHFINPSYQRPKVTRNQTNDWSNSVPEAYKKYFLGGKTLEAAMRGIDDNDMILMLYAGYNELNRHISEVQARLNGLRGQQYSTAAQLLLSIEAPEQGLLLEEDQAKMRAGIQSFVSNHIQDLNHPLYIILPPRWVAADLASASVQVRKRHISLQAALVGLEQHLRVQKWD